ncbi:MAG TPA: signal peptide peptidase SppA, partial [Pirellulales bacterium]|nr:signal peptide peptidase SppA [Pirellulales bacterium]
MMVKRAYVGGRLSGLVICLATSFAWGADEPAKVTAKKMTLGSIAVREDYPEGVAATGLFSEFKPHLRELMDRLDKAAKDEHIAGVVLRLREPTIGLAKVGELRAAIGRVRKAGKKVYADVHSASTRDFLIASACDQVIMPESGALMITGMEAEVIFFKGLFDKLGIQADFVQIGDFKGASEPFTRTSMSADYRHQFESVIDDFYQYIVESIAQDRKLEPEKVKKLIDVGLFSAQAARDAGLVDRIGYEDQWRDELRKELGADELSIERDYGKKKSELEVGGMAGMMKFMEMLMGGEQKSKLSKNNKIAVIYAVGPIMTGESASSFLGGATVGSDTIIHAFRQAEADAKVKAIVLRVDSPGGSALASDLIWRQIVTAKKPVVASMGDIAASGGYYISMSAKKIFAEPGTLTGSIGVVGGKLALRGLFEKIGVNAESIKRGKNSSVLSVIDPFSAEERDAWKRLMTETYQQFTSKAAAGRKMEVAKLESLAQGRLYTGRMAVSCGLADQLGTLEDAVAEAKSMAGLKAEDAVDLWILPQSKSFLEQLLGTSTIEAEARAVAPEMV